MQEAVIVTEVPACTEVLVLLCWESIQYMGLVALHLGISMKVVKFHTKLVQCACEGPCRPDYHAGMYTVRHLESLRPQAQAAAPGCPNRH